MNCLITGANGVVGSNISNILEHTYGWNIYRLLNSGFENENKFSADIRCTDALGLVVKKIRSVDVVVHCAAKLDNDTNSAELFDVNVVGSLNILGIAKKLGASHFINISSVPVIGLIKSTPITEEHICNPFTQYHLSKLHAEQALEINANNEIKLFNFRIPSPAGLNMPQRSILPVLIFKALNNKEIFLTGHANRRQNYLDVRDLVSAIELCTKSNSKGGVFNIASDTQYTNLELAEIIVETLGSSSKIMNKMVNDDLYYEDWLISIDKANKEFSYLPKFNVKDTIKWLVEEHRN